jgi:hypothetical protein
LIRIWHNKEKNELSSWFTPDMLFFWHWREEDGFKINIFLKSGPVVDLVLYKK